MCKEVDFDDNIFLASWYAEPSPIHYVASRISDSDGDEHGHGQGQYATTGGGRWEASRDAGHTKKTSAPQQNFGRRQEVGVSVNINEQLGCHLLDLYWAANNTNELNNQLAMLNL
jgi:hypothetical protein